MRVLLIEDDQDFIDAVSQVLSEITGSPTVCVARSKGGAELSLKNDFFDLILLDLKIPTEDGLLDADPQHGRATFYAARQQAPGTPIFVLTGSPAEDFIEDFLQGSQQVDIWSEGHQTQTVQFLQKYRFPQFRPRIEAICRAVWDLSEVELVFPSSLQIATPFDRLLRIFSKKYGGARCEIGLVGGGLSSAKVYRLRITSNDGTCIHNAIAKLGSSDDIRAEGERFDSFVNRLDAAATPRKLCVLEFGAKNSAGVFYSLAADFSLDGFSVATSMPTVAAGIPARLSEMFRPWWHGVPETRHSIMDIRRKLLSDQELTKILQQFPTLWVSELEARQIQVRWCCTHGDLHGKNVLVSEDGRCVLIDYGDVGEGTVSIDPITYELSLLFHPEGILRGSGWPTLDQAAHWGDIGTYTQNCPVADVVREIRAWTHVVAAGRREIAATAYAYLLRQYKYSDTDKALISALLEAVHNYFLAT
jgi:CheY-like chemotaxis protein